MNSLFLFKKEATLFRFLAQCINQLRHNPEGRGFEFRRKSLGYFIGLILLGRTMFLGSTQPVTEVTTRDVTWAANFVTFMYRFSRNSGSLGLLEP
jgi:hypothetical protein